LVWCGTRTLDGAQRSPSCSPTADLSGFTRLVESVDPEVVYEVVRPMMDEFVALVHAHGGEIQQVLGDGFMSVFGLREPRGDDAARAVRAGLTLVEAAGRQPGRLPTRRPR
jgi:class 3 adenylate cyclase